MQKLKQRLILRTIWLKIHLWLALTVGFLFVLIGLTGSLSIYHQELDELLNPQLVIEQSQTNWQSLDKIMAAVHAAHPKRYGSWTLEMPRTPNSVLTAWFEKPRETFFELYAPLMVSVNPYTAEVVDSRFWGQTLMTWLLDVHTQLLMNRFGWNAVGICGGLLMLSVLSGLYLWWPGAAHISSVLKINYRNGLIRLLFDLHKITGVLFAPVLLFLAITGMLLSYPTILEKLGGSSGMAHGETGRSIVSTAIPHSHPTGLESAEFMARGSFPRSTLRRITTPAGETGVYRINLRQANEVNQRHPYTTVWVDRWSGQVKEVRDPYRFTTAETLQTWLWPLHTGEALGAKGRLLWFLAGPGLLFLYVSGVLRWLHRRGKVQERTISFNLDVNRCLHQLQAWLQVAVPILLSLLKRGLQEVNTLINHAIPYLKLFNQWLWQTFYQLRRAWIDQQKRLGKD